MSRWFGRRRAAHIMTSPVRQRPRLVELEARLTPADIFVATTGSNATGNGSLAAPYATLARGLQAADPGDHVVLRAGTYAGGVTVDEPDITIRSHDGEWAVISSPTSNSSIGQTIWLDPNADRFTLRRVEVVGGYFYAVKAETDSAEGRGNAATHLLIEDSKLHDSGRDVIKLTPGCDDVTIRRTEIYNSGRRDSSNAEGIDNVNGDRMTLQDSHIHDIATTGVYPKGGAIAPLIERNRIERVGSLGIAVGFYTDTEFFDPVANPGYYESIDAVVRNNVIADTPGAGVGFYASKGARVYNNTLVNVGDGVQAPVTVSSVEQWFEGGVVKFQTNVDMWFVNNVVVQAAGSTDEMVDIRDGGRSGPATFANNRYHHPDGPAVFRDRGVNPSAGGVDFAEWQTLGYDAGSSEGSPGVDGTGHLQSGSPVINAGRAVAGLTDDIDRHARTGAPDVGADEWDGTSPPRHPLPLRRPRRLRLRRPRRLHRRRRRPRAASGSTPPTTRSTRRAGKRPSPSPGLVARSGR